MNRTMTKNMTKPIKKNQVINDYGFTNIITNGNFVGTTGWSAVGCSLSSLNNTLSITGDGTNAAGIAVNLTTIASLVDKKIYGKCIVRVTNSSCTAIRMYAYNGAGTVTLQIISNPVQNQWYAITGIAVQTSIGTQNLDIRIYHQYADAATANGKVMEVKEVMAIDLTSTYGKGNEPNKAECDSLFDTWFNGTETF